MSGDGGRGPRALAAAAGLLLLGILGWVLPTPVLPGPAIRVPPAAAVWALSVSGAGTLLLLLLAARTAAGRGWGPETSWAARPRFGPLEFVGLLLFWHMAPVLFLPALEPVALSEGMRKFVLTLLSMGATTVLGIVLWYVQAQARRRTPVPMLRGSTILRDLALGVGLGVAILPIVACGERIGCLLIDLAGGTVEIQNVVQEIAAEDSRTGLAVALVFVLVGAPLFEEMLFRGFLFHALRRALGVWPSAAISAALFAAIHGNVYATLPTFTLGMGLALLYERNGSLAAPMAMHATFNAVNVVTILLGRGPA
jgi:membrane protease YdiL (CAAX protease family)